MKNCGLRVEMWQEKGHRIRLKSDVSVTFLQVLLTHYHTCRFNGIYTGPGAPIILIEARSRIGGIDCSWIYMKQLKPEVSQKTASVVVILMNGNKSLVGPYATGA